MYAIIEDSGTQIKVSEGDVVELDVRKYDESKPEITFDRVLAAGDGQQAAKVGTPYLDGASVTGEILDAFRGPKVDVIKYKRRKGYRVKKGHRQPLLRVKINAINA